MGMGGGGTGCLKAPYSRGRLSPRHFYPHPLSFWDAMLSV